MGDFTHKENDEVEHLLHLDCVDFLLVRFLLQSGYHRWESEIGKGLDSLEQALFCKV